MGDNFKPIIDNNENKQITLNSIFKYLNIPALLICDLNFMIKNPECKKLVWKCMLELQKINVKVSNLNFNTGIKKLENQTISLSLPL